MSRSLRIALLLLLAATATGCLDTTLDASYPTMAAAVADDAVSRGWVPDWVPTNAIDLREVHDLDSNESALSFNLPAGTKPTLPARCRPVQASDALQSRFNRSWWPATNELERSYALYSCSTEFVGVRKSGGRVLHWRTSAR